MSDEWGQRTQPAPQLDELSRPVEIRTQRGMRYFEWLFPIMKYVRLRREVSGWRVFATAVLTTLVPAMAIIGPEVYSYVRNHRISRGWWPGIPPISTWELVREYFLDWTEPAGILIGLGITLLVLALVEQVLALWFVLKRPGRRRPVCHWQTLKYVMLGGQTWTIYGLLLIFMPWIIGRLGLLSSREAAVQWTILTGIVVFYVALPLILLGSIAIQSAYGVIALQDDRRCQKCGYFLIHLIQPRCPECGTQFDPAKLGRLTAIFADGETP